MAGVIVILIFVTLVALWFGTWLVHQGINQKRASRAARWKGVIIGSIIVGLALIFPINAFLGIILH